MSKRTYRNYQSEVRRENNSTTKYILFHRENASTNWKLKWNASATVCHLGHTSLDYTVSISYEILHWSSWNKHVIATVSVKKELLFGLHDNTSIKRIYSNFILSKKKYLWLRFLNDISCQFEMKAFQFVVFFSCSL